MKRKTCACRYLTFSATFIVVKSVEIHVDCFWHVIIIERYRAFDCVPGGLVVVLTLLSKCDFFKISFDYPTPLDEVVVHHKLNLSRYHPFIHMGGKRDRDSVEKHYM